MTINNTTKTHLPINHREPTIEEIQARKKREQDASVLGKMKAMQKLLKQKQGMDYSRSEGGSRLLDQCLTMTGAAITDRLEMASRRAGMGASYIGPIYKRLNQIELINLPKLDQDGKPVEVKDGNGNLVTPLAGRAGRTVNIWDEGEIAFIVLLTLLDTCQMPLIGDIQNQSKAGMRFGTRPAVYKLETLISARINDHLAHKYIRECLKNTGNDKTLDFILKDAYSPSASWQQKKTNTRLARKKKAQEFIDTGLTPMARILEWKPFTNREGHALAGALISSAVVGCEAALDMAVFETVDRFKDQFYGLTEAAQREVDLLDQARINRTFSADVMVCPPRPHSKNESGGYLGVAQSLIRRSFTGGFKGEFIPSDHHLRLLNGQQNIPWKINPVMLELLNRLHELPTQDIREQGHFIPAPDRDQFLISPEMEEEPVNMTSKQKEARDELRKLRRAEFASYMRKRKESDGSLTEDTLDLANRISGLERFWLPCQGDFRGRNYCSNHLMNSQGMSYQRNLLMFANGKPVDHRTQFHLEVAIAGYAGQDKISFEQRREWFRQHRDQILDSVTDWDSILDPGSFWRNKKKAPQMDDEFAFLASVLEWKRLFIDNDPYRVTHLIIFRDATASGAQHIAGYLQSNMTAAAVNLLPNASGVFDIYVAVLDEMKRLIRDLDYKIPLLDKDMVPVKEKGEVQFMPEKRVRYLFKTDPATKANLRKPIKSGFLPRLYGSGIGKSISAIRDKFRFLDNKTKKGAKLSGDETRAIAQFFEAGLNKTVPALNAYVEWARNLADQALRTKVENPMTKAGKPAKRDQYTPVLDEDGNELLELVCPTPNGSKMIMRYPTLKNKKLRIDHLTTYSKYKPITDYRDEVLKVAKPEVNHSDLQKACPPNIIHASDAAQLAFTVDDFDGNYSLIHVAFGATATAELDELIERARVAYIKCVTSGYLQGLLEANGVDPERYAVPVYGSFNNPEISKDAHYMIC